MTDAWIWTSAAAARLRMVVREKATQDGLVEATGIPKATLQRILAGKTDPGRERLQKVVDAVGADIEEILKGGDPLAEKVTEVPINDIMVSAGPGKFALDEDQRIGSWPFPRDWLEERFGDVSKLRLVTVSGDSQEPELRDGDSVLINLADQKLQDGMAIVSLDEALLIKRVQIEGARVRLKSANPNYNDTIVDLTADQERFRVVARAVWTMKQL